MLPPQVIQKEPGVLGKLPVEPVKSQSCEELALLCSTITTQEQE